MVKKNTAMLGVLSLGALILASNLVSLAHADDGGQDWTATALDCSVRGGKYYFFVEVNGNSFAAHFEKMGTIDLGPDQKHTPTVVDWSTPVQVNRELLADGWTRFSGGKIDFEVKADMVLPLPNPPLAPGGESQILFHGTLTAPAGLVKGMPALHEEALDDCTYSD